MNLARGLSAIIKRNYKRKCIEILDDFRLRHMTQALFAVDFRNRVRKGRKVAASVVVVVAVVVVDRVLILSVTATSTHQLSLRTNTQSRSRSDRRGCLSKLTTGYM